MANTVSTFDIKKVQQVAKKASDKAIEKATAYLWKVARNSVKKSSTKQSAPGTPPKTHPTHKKGWKNYWLKERIWRDKKTGTVYVNPDRKPTEGASKLPVLLEEGGTQQIIVTRVVANRRNRRNTEGKNWIHYRSMESRSEDEQKYIKAYYDNITIRKRVTRTLQARPFLVPAMKKAAEKLLEILKGSINK